MILGDGREKRIEMLWRCLVGGMMETFRARVFEGARLSKKEDGRTCLVVGSGGERGLGGQQWWLASRTRDEAHSPVMEMKTTKESRILRKG